MVQSISTEIAAAFPVEEVEFTLFLVLSVRAKGGLRFVLSTNDRHKVDDHKGAIKKMVGGGGGRPGTFQGTATNAKVIEDVLALLKAGLQKGDVISQREEKEEEEESTENGNALGRI